MLNTILFFCLLKLSFTTDVTVTIENAPFNECYDDCWTGVSFYFDGQVVNKNIDDVCGNGNGIKKSFKVNLRDTAAIRKGNMELRLNEAKTRKQECDHKSLWHVEKITVNTNEFQVIIGIGRQIVSSRRYTIRNYDTVVRNKSFMTEQTIQDGTVLRSAYDTTSGFGSAPVILKRLSKEDEYQHEAHVENRGLRIDEIKAMFFFGIKMLFPSYNVEFENFQEIIHFWENDNFGSIYSIPKEVRMYWREDAWFGTQRLQGSNPLLIKSISEIPNSFKLNKSKLEPLIKGRNLSDAFAKNEIFLADVQMLDNLDNDNIWAPQALFHLQVKHLIPVAIQLRRTDSAEDVFYRDNSDAWMLAKLYYNCAEAVDLNIVRHLGYTHIFVQAIGISMNRFLPPNNPIAKLMKSHLWGTFGTNYGGYFNILGDDGSAERVLQGHAKVSRKLLNKAMANVDYNEINPDIDIQMRKVGKDRIPVYPVRDRGLDIYHVLKKFVAEIIKNYYEQDEDVRNDDDLKMFRYDLSLSSEYHGAGIKNLPGSDIDGKMTKDDLTDILTTVIYQATAGHAIISNGVFEQSGFPLNYPSMLRKPPPKASNVLHINENYVRECLPTKNVVFEAGVLGKHFATSVGTPFGEVENQLLHSPQDQKVYQRLQKSLNRLKNKTYENVDKRFPYRYLDIDSIRNSIRS